MNSPQAHRSRRLKFLAWLRKIHMYVGLWGAALGMLFGMTGIVMNHRAVLKLPVEKTVQKTVQLPLPERGFTAPKDMSTWLQQELHFTPVAPAQIKLQPARKVIWGDKEVQQPERWTINLQRPGGGVNAEYFVGNRFVKLDLIDATPIGTLTRLHTANGVNAFWVVLTDTIAGSIILLSITGLLMWTQMRTFRLSTALVGVTALSYATCYVWWV